ncbi:YbaN family protein [Phaeovulum sp. NW3]|uniref:YbaN family protein n=1 Tax=Phaeovulum sp. NW3 TaxID=2934933 RepID=UPI002022105C|nr:YbaN family protein [Phaeovulum sp. NW3]MCL7465493.1 YbaN family protein [Phaeovulum sp. NW3]
MRFLWLIAGLVCFALGVIGAFLPLLPTVPLMLLAAFCFARSSERLHNWLLSHPRFGPAIIDWSERRSIARPAKWAASVSILAAFALSVALGVGPKILVIQGIVLIAVAVFIWSRPDS